MKRSVTILSLVIAFQASHLANAQTVLYVDDDATGANDGSSWCDGFVFLQDALVAAAASGGIVTEVRVAQGTYKPDQGGSQTLSNRAVTP